MIPQPGLPMGQPVFVEINGKIEGVPATVKKPLFVIGARIAANENHQYIEYALGVQVPAPYVRCEVWNWLKREQFVVDLTSIQPNP